MSKVLVIGGGVIGMCSAYYISKAGYDVVVLDRGDFTSGTSFGNAGYVSPSHFVPLAAPGIVSQGLKWMLSTTSPFYIKPRLDIDLIKWGFEFWRRSGKSIMQKNIPVLNEMLHLGRSLTKEMHDELNRMFLFEEKGCLMLYKSHHTEKHEIELAKLASTYGIETEVLDGKGVQEIEPQVEVNVRGGVFYPTDAHLNPAQFMKTLHDELKKRGVTFITNTEVESFEKTGKKLTGIVTSNGYVNADEYVLAAGSWLPLLCKKLNVNLLMQAGKGYSMTFNNLSYNLTHPSILVDHRVATTPLGPNLRIGGTMEISGIGSPKLIKRAKAIFDATRQYYPNLEISFPKDDEIWTGYRPLSPDGMPYIGKHSLYENVVIAGGHAMLGISLAAATGKLVEEVLNNRKTTMNIKALDIER